MKKTPFIEAGALKMHLELLKHLKNASGQPIFAVQRRRKRVFQHHVCYKRPRRYSGSLKFWLICFSVRLVSEKSTRERRAHYLLCFIT